MANVPLGYRFHPTREELIYCLFCFLSRKPLSSNAAIPVKDLYSDDPWEVCGWITEPQYFFTPLKRASDKGFRFARTVGKEGKGTWCGKSKIEEIRNGRNQIVGYYKDLRYQCKGSEEDGLWLMREYSLSPNLKKSHVFDDDEYKDYVVCRIKRKGPKRASKFSGDPIKNPVFLQNKIENTFGFVDGGSSVRTGNPITISVYDEVAARPSWTAPNLEGFDGTFSNDFWVSVIDLDSGSVSLNHNLSIKEY